MGACWNDDMDDGFAIGRDVFAIGRVTDAIGRDGFAMCRVTNRS